VHAAVDRGDAWLDVVLRDDLALMYTPHYHHGCQPGLPAARKRGYYRGAHRRSDGYYRQRDVTRHLRFTRLHAGRFTQAAITARIRQTGTG